MDNGRVCVVDMDTGVMTALHVVCVVCVVFGKLNVDIP